METKKTVNYNVLNFIIYGIILVLGLVLLFV